MGSGSRGGNHGSYDYSFKILLIGDSGVGKSSLLLSFISNSVHDLSPTIGILFSLWFSFKIMLVSVIVWVQIIIQGIWSLGSQESFKEFGDSTVEWWMLCDFLSVSFFLFGLTGQAFSHKFKLVILSLKFVFLFLIWRTLFLFWVLTFCESSKSTIEILSFAISGFE